MEDNNPIFQLNKPIPKVWLHMEFSWGDTVKYMNDTVIPNKEELDRLVNKYLGGKNHVT